MRKECLKDIYPWLHNYSNAGWINLIEQVERQPLGGQIARDPSAAADVIRLETFETLGISHTCCKGSDEDNSFIPRYELEEIAEIHEEQSELIQEHEQLVSSFVQKYGELGEPLSSFLFGYWRTHMARVLTYRQPGRNAERARIRDIGVVIKSEIDEGGMNSVGDDNELKGDLDPDKIHDSGKDKLLNEDGADQIHSHGDNNYSVSKGPADEQPEPDILSLSHLCSASCSSNKRISDRGWLDMLVKYGPYDHVDYPGDEDE